MDKFASGNKLSHRKSGEPLSAVSEIIDLYKDSVIFNGLSEF